MHHVVEAFLKPRGEFDDAHACILVKAELRNSLVLAILREGKLIVFIDEEHAYQICGFLDTP